MTEVRSYTNGHGGSFSGPVPQAPNTGDFINTLQNAARENPLSAALIGMGVLWMFMGGSNITLFGGRGRKSIFRTAVQGVEQVGGAVRDTAGRAGSSVGHATQAAGEAVFQAAGGVREGSAAVAKMASRTAEQTADAVDYAYDSTVNVASRAAQAISNATTSGARSVRDTGTKWGNTVQQNIADTLERQPLLLGALGLAIGAGIAASIPTTRTEKKVMGAASDFVRETVTDKVAEAKEIAGAALQEAKAQGLTPKAAGEALRVVGEKVASVAQASSSTHPAGNKSGLGSKKS